MAPPGTLLSASEAFVWPLEGPVVLPFAAKEDGVSLKGVVLEGRDGAAVTASRSGQVILVDERLRGYGKTVILEHADGFVTVYARNSEILVRPGQSVSRGQAIAKVGRGGKGGLPRLYFEVRRNGRAEDPAQILSSKRS